MKITIKKLEITFVIMYFLAALLCFFLFRSKSCLLGSLVGWLVSIGDWYLLKFMAKRWLKRGGYSFVDYGLRFAIVAVSILLLLKSGFSPVGIIIGVSVIPVSLMMLAVLSLFRKITV
ncbi:hypothetical protein [Hippea maritima]|uniref:ATP synthase I n=1 Tax=Hippea maritima (strain ATCC 700847 / DSM 10411 / MH2) TaxID=760142 RepID=F2LVN3_HIPMA|nr:hypothetical protein [Hippea maritima]AEA33817.1 hypothetical protein Hipma_0847 [Hippea maritima DSM 10411]